MKLKFILILIIIAIPYQGNSMIIKTTNTYVVLMGKVINQRSFISSDLITAYTVKRGYSKLTNFSAEIDSSGVFRLIIDWKYAGTVRLSYKDSYFNAIIHPGDSLFVVIDNNAIGLGNFVRFFGDAADINNQLYTFTYGLDSINKNYHFFEMFKSDSALKVIHTSDLFHKEIVKYKDDFFKKYNPDYELRAWIDCEIVYQYTSSLFLYPNNHCILNNLSLKDFDFGNGYYSFIDSIPKLKTDYLINSEAMRYFINYYLGFFIRTMVLESNNWNWNDPNEDSLIIDGIKKYSKHDGLLRQLMLTELFNWKFDDLDTAFYSNNLNVLRQYVNEPFLNESLTNQFTELKKAILTSIEASNALIKSIQNSNFTSLLDTLRRNNVGSIIYVDIWATWCGPCRTEMPLSKELYQKLKGKNVIFVYLCIDSDKDKWNALLLDLKLPDYQVYCDKITSTNIRNDLNISGIPHYVLIDKQGNIIGNGFELRPSGSLIEQKINELLEDKK
jgi:thiol-disulfide isomerase/thioredoxin